MECYFLFQFYYFFSSLIFYTSDNTRLNWCSLFKCDYHKIFFKILNSYHCCSFIKQKINLLLFFFSFIHSLFPFDCSLWYTKYVYFLHLFLVFFTPFTRNYFKRRRLHVYFFIQKTNKKREQWARKNIIIKYFHKHKKHHSQIHKPTFIIISL